MSLDTLTAQLKSQAAMNPPLGYRVKFDLGEDGVLFWDGTVTPAEIGAPEGDPEADTVLLTVPNQLGVDYNAHVIEAILKHVAPGLGWR